MGCRVSGVQRDHISEDSLKSIALSRALGIDQELSVMVI